MLIPSLSPVGFIKNPSLSRRVNANSQLYSPFVYLLHKLIKKGEC